MERQDFFRFKEILDLLLCDLWGWGDERKDASEIRGQAFHQGVLLSQGLAEEVQVLWGNSQP